MEEEGAGYLNIHNWSDFEARLCVEALDGQRCFVKRAALPSSA